MSELAEETVRAAWCEVLGVGEAAEDQNFFDLGGDSLMAIIFMERIESGLGIDFPMQALLMDGEYRAVLAECVALRAQTQG
ncbi:acyl carrier protein [Actinoplanes derwentensis]|uniref:Phosphopantetheine attachment site n=1 Tax=Actinoplanes derwentensis TaxID=113562 RepID=A0A1H2CI32_9ACTN|nr:acyl carrier protein [Actinoplanes derwentensis]GID89587.1 hypothetical protein Ade03nite_85110 [Actinoplanes derwentensis]SDT70175.1 Phosphopantetheine attachment site [Actinoplanes derwentensis]